MQIHAFKLLFLFDGFEGDVMFISLNRSVKLVAKLKNV